MIQILIIKIMFICKAVRSLCFLPHYVLFWTSPLLPSNPYNGLRATFDVLEINWNSPARQFHLSKYVYYLKYSPTCAPLWLLLLISRQNVPPLRTQRLGQLHTLSIRLKYLINYGMNHEMRKTFIVPRGWIIMKLREHSIRRTLFLSISLFLFPNSFSWLWAFNLC